MFWTLPRDESIPIIKGFIKLDLILFNTNHPVLLNYLLLTKATPHLIKEKRRLE